MHHLTDTYKWITSSTSAPGPGAAGPPAAADGAPAPQAPGAARPLGPTAPPPGVSGAAVAGPASAPLQWPAPSSGSSAPGPAAAAPATATAGRWIAPPTLSPGPAAPSYLSVVAGSSAPAPQYSSVRLPPASQLYPDLPVAASPAPRAAAPARPQSTTMLYYAHGFPQPDRVSAAVDDAAPVPLECKNGLWRARLTHAAGATATLEIDGAREARGFVLHGRHVFEGRAAAYLEVAGHAARPGVRAVLVQFEMLKAAHASWSLPGQKAAFVRKAIGLAQAGPGYTALLMACAVAHAGGQWPADSAPTAIAALTGSVPGPELLAVQAHMRADPALAQPVVQGVAALAAAALEGGLWLPLVPWLSALDAKWMRKHPRLRTQACPSVRPSAPAPRPRRLCCGHLCPSLECTPSPAPDQPTTAHAHCRGASDWVLGGEAGPAGRAVPETLVGVRAGSGRHCAHTRSPGNRL